MKEIYREIVTEIEAAVSNVMEAGFYMPAFPQYCKIVGNIVPGTFTVIGGMPGSGKTSFIDQNYVLNPLYQVMISYLDKKKNADENLSNPNSDVVDNPEDFYQDDTVDIPNLKIIYFSMDNDVKTKLKLFLSNYIHTFHRKRVDINILTNSSKRTNDLPTVLPNYKDVLAKAEVLFDTALQKKVLTIFSGVETPVSIAQKIVNELKHYGTVDKDNVFTPQAGYEDLQFIIVIDGLNYVRHSNGEFATTKAEEQEVKLALLHLATLLRDKYNATVVYGMNTDGYSTNGRWTTVPSYKQLAEYGQLADVGTIIFQPISEGIYHGYLDPSEQHLYVINGTDYLRYWEVVKNKHGRTAAKSRFILSGATLFGYEYPNIAANMITKQEDIASVLFNFKNLY